VDGLRDHPHHRTGRRIPIWHQVVVEHQGKASPGERQTLIKPPVGEHPAGHPRRQHQIRTLQGDAPQAGIQASPQTHISAVALLREQTAGSRGVLINGEPHRQLIGLQHG
jgi:hypothetical protein